MATYKPRFSVVLLLGVLLCLNASWANDTQAPDVSLLGIRQAYRQTRYADVLNLIQACEQTPQPRCPEPYKLAEFKAMVYQQQVQHAAEITAWQQALALAHKTMPKEDVRIVLLLQRLQAALGSAAQLTEAKKISAQTKPLQDALYKAGKAAYFQKITVLESPATDRPVNGEMSMRSSWYLWADLLAEHHQDEQALEAYQQTLAVAKQLGLNTYDIHMSIGYLYQSRGQLPQAEQQFSTALALLPQQHNVSVPAQASVMATKGMFHYYRGERSHAKALLQQALALQNQCPSPLETVFLKIRYYLKKIDRMETEQPHYFADLAERPENDAARKVAYKVTRWHDATQQLKIYIPTPPADFKNWDTRYMEWVKHAFDTWNAVFGNRFTLVYVPHDKQYDVKVTWLERATPTPYFSLKNTPVWAFDASRAERLGANQMASLANGKLILNNLNLTVAHSDGYPFSPERMQSLILHEVGHNFGLNGHSNLPSDVMFEGTPDGFNVVQLSERDKATLRYIYAQPADVSNDPKQSVSDVYKRLGVPVQNSVDF